MEGFLLLLGLGALVYALVIDSRRKRDVAAFEEKFTNLTREFESLHTRLRNLAATAPVTAVAAPPPSQAPAPSQAAAAHTAPPAYAPLVVPKPVMLAPVQSPAPAVVTPPATVAPMMRVDLTTSAPGVIPPPPVPAPPQHPAAEIPPASVRSAEPKPAAPPPPPFAPARPTPTPPHAPSVAVPPRPPMPVSAAPLQTAAHAAATAPARTVQAVVRKPKRSFEEVLGTKWLPIIGIIGVIISLGYLLSYGWGHFTAWERDLILYVGSFSLLAGGIFLEKKERYKNLGRVLIGGGWAATAAVTYAIGNRPHEQILPSPTVDLFLLLGVIAAMVWHTLKYRSQVVTGAAFLLGFVAIGMNADPPYNLIAAAMLICGMTVIVWKYQWFELEVFGILASYINQFYWLYQVYEEQGQRAIFPYHSASVVLVIVYWFIFRFSYLFRKISGGRQEFVSTFAGLLNPILFLAVMKYQGFHPEWAWWFLLVMGFVEFSLGQLPTSRRRRAPFQILSSLGATLIVAAPFVRGSGNALEVLWLVCAEAFLLAGIFTRERLFRCFGLIISFLVALYALPMRVVPLLRDVLTAQPHHVAQTGLVLAAIALALYANAHFTRRFWPALFEEALEDFSLSALSFAASLFAVAAVYATVPDHVIAFALALFVLWLSLTGKLFSIGEMIYEAHWVTVVAFIQVVVADHGSETKWLGVPQRVLAFGSVAALLYLSSRFVRLSETQGKALFSGAYAWAGTALLTLLIWFQATSWAVGVAWILLALALSLAGQALKRSDLKWQAFALVLLSSLRALTINMNITATWPHLTYRLVSVSVIALGIYLLARWAPRQQTRPVYSVAGTLLLTVLAFKEAPAPWTAVAWVTLALVLSLAARWWKDRPLLWQTHLLSALAAGWTLYANFAPQYRESQLLTVGITAAVLYALTWLTNIAAVIEDERICQAYAWAGSLLVSWLAWYQLHPIEVSLAWGVFGLLLFEFPDLAKAIKVDVSRAAASWRGQAYVALAGSFAHIFYSNFNVSGWGPAAYIALALAPIYFFIYWETGRREASSLEKTLRVDLLLACLGTATLAALARFELPADTVVIGYAALVVGTLLVCWLANRQVFLFQSVVMLAVAAFRICTNNFYHVNEQVNEPFGSSFSSSVWAIALLACAVPLAFQVRNHARKAAQDGISRGWFSALALHPEQLMFFVPVVLLAVLLALKLTGGKMTIAWAGEGFAVFVLALWAKERSFRWTGLSLLLVSAAKLAVYDSRRFHSPPVRFMTWIGVSVLILLVAFLYGKYREALRDYL